MPGRSLSVGETRPANTSRNNKCGLKKKGVASVDTNAILCM